MKMARRNHFERDDADEEKGAARSSSRFFYTRSPRNYPIQGMYKSEGHMIRELGRISARLNLTWLAHAVSEFLGRRKPVLQGRLNSIRIGNPIAMRNGGAREITGLCSFCNFWDKACGTGCLVKRMKGDEFTCPYTNGDVSYSTAKAGSLKWWYQCKPCTTSGQERGLHRTQSEKN
jgi:hypothetical protein